MKNLLKLLKEILTEGLKKLTLKFLIFSLSFDLLFLFVFGFFSGPVFMKLFNFYNFIGMKLTSLDFNELMYDNEVTGYFKSIIGLYILLGAIIYVFYSLFQGITWWLANNQIKKIDCIEYLMYFFKVNIVFLLLFALSHFLLIIGDIWKTLYDKTGIFVFLSYLILILILYFAPIKYTKRKLKRDKKLILVYVFVFLGFFVLNYLVEILMQLNFAIGIFIGILIVFPFMAYSKVLIANKKF